MKDLTIIIPAGEKTSRTQRHKNRTRKSNKRCSEED
jgi:hypothetical protein